MKGLTTLIKLSKRQLDELRRKLGGLENQKSELQKASAKLSQELQHEIEMAGKTPEMAGFFAGFAQRIKNRQQQIGKEIAALDKQMDQLRDEITVAFGEQKKYEIALENAKQRKREEQNRKETLLLDEVAAQQHNKKQKEEQ